MPATHRAASRRDAARPGLRAAVALSSAAATAGILVLAGPLAVASASGTSAVADTHPAWATSSADQGAAAPTGTITTSVFLAGQNQTGMAAYAQAVADPSGADYQDYLSPSQYQARFGATAAQVSAVEAWLRGAGLTAIQASDQTITATGSVAATESAYGVTLHNYLVKGTTYRAPTADAQIPAAISADVLQVNGLEDMPDVVEPAGLVGEVSTPLVTGASGVNATQSTGGDGAPFLGATSCSAYYGQKIDTTDPAFAGSPKNPYAVCGYVPSQMRSAYGVSQSGLTGRGATVAIVDAYGSPTILADANEYATGHGDPAFKAGQFTESVTPSAWTDESACQGPADWAVEESLDVEAVHGMAPGANVRYYGANSCEDPDFLRVFDTILDTRSAQIVSNSWAGVIYSSTGDEDPTAIAEYTHDFEQGAIEGISFQFSAGDCGAEDPATGCGANDTSTAPQSDFPASDPWATSVGGTSLAIGRQGQQLWNTAWGTDAWESTGTAWDSIGWIYGGGGATSQYFPEPWYQDGVVPAQLAHTLPNGSKASEAMRVSPDVAMDADPFTGFLFGETRALPGGGTGYGESDIGGTSLACPLFAGLQADAVQARHGRPLGFENPALYAKAHSPAFTDVTGSGAGTHAVNVLPPSGGEPALAVTFGDDRLLAAAPGFDDATGVGTASARYLWYAF